MHLDSFVDSSTVWIVYLLKFHCREQGGQMQDFHVLGFKKPEIYKSPKLRVFLNFTIFFSENFKFKLFFMLL